MVSEIPWAFLICLPPSEAGLPDTKWNSMSTNWLTSDDQAALMFEVEGHSRWQTRSHWKNWCWYKRATWPILAFVGELGRHPREALGTKINSHNELEINLAIWRLLQEIRCINFHQPPHLPALSMVQNQILHISGHCEDNIQLHTCIWQLLIFTLGCFRI